MRDVVRRERNTAKHPPRGDALGGFDVTIALGDRRAASAGRGENERGRFGVRLGGRHRGGPDHLGGDFDGRGRRLQLGQQAADIAVAVMGLRRFRGARTARRNTRGLSSQGLVTAALVVAEEAIASNRLALHRLAANGVTTAAHAGKPVQPVADRRQKDIPHRERSRQRP